jgi:hypothetical protein
MIKIELFYKVHGVWYPVIFISFVNLIRVFSCEFLQSLIRQVFQKFSNFFMSFENYLQNVPCKKIKTTYICITNLVGVFLI